MESSLTSLNRTKNNGATGRLAEVMGCVLVAGLVVILDQLTKYVATAKLSLGQSVEVISGFFSFTLVHNRGAAFGMFSGLPDGIRQGVLWGVSLLAFLFVVRLFLVEARDDRWSLLALALILGGALGNKICRFRQDYVIDFIDFYVRDYHWPAFNIADSAICIGVALLMFRMMKADHQKRLHEK